MKSKGRFGDYGGVFVPEILFPALEELEKAFYDAQKSESFHRELNDYLKSFAGRPTPVYRCRNIVSNPQAKIYLKREDLLHGGAHKTNQVLGQALLAKKIGKTRLIAETGAGQRADNDEECAADPAPVDLHGVRIDEAGMAPEQLEGGAIGPATDLHALGAVLYEVLTGRQAFDHACDAVGLLDPQLGKPVHPARAPRARGGDREDLSLVAPDRDLINALAGTNDNLVVVYIGGSGIDMSGMDTNVRPQDDFFDYMNGKWVAETELPADRARWGTSAPTTPPPASPSWGAPTSISPPNRSPRPPAFCCGRSWPAGNSSSRETRTSGCSGSWRCCIHRSTSGRRIGA